MTETARIALDDFERVCRKVPYRVKGIFYSEVYLFLCRCVERNVDLIIESGVKHGMSTRMLAAVWPGELISIDKDSQWLQAVEGVTFLHGDSHVIVPQVLCESVGRRAAVLIDGPKGEGAAALMRAAWTFSEVQLVAIHDIGLGVRLASWAMEPSHHSQAPAFREAAGRRLDALIRHDYAKKYPHGSGLAIWEKKQ